MALDKAPLRERQKHLRRESMLAAARTLFVEVGYSKTTMDAIAEQAGVGVATVHTYFSTKEGLFAELAKMDMSELKEEAEVLLRHLPEDPLASVHGLLDIYIKVQNYISYDVMSDFVGGSRKPGPMREVAVWINRWQRDYLTHALRHGQSVGKVSGTLPVEEMSWIIHDLLVRFFDRVTAGENSVDEYAKLRKRVGLLFANWTNG